VLVTFLSGREDDMTRNERIRKRLPNGTPEEMAWEKAEEVIQRGFKQAMSAMRMMKIDPETKEDIIGENVVSFCTKAKIEVTALTDKITKAEKVRTDKIKEEKIKEEKEKKPK